MARRRSCSTAFAGVPGQERRSPPCPAQFGGAGGLVESRKRGDGTGPVIRNAAGEPLAGPRYWFEKAIRKAAIANFHWHDIRHTFASRLAMAGVGLRANQEALGHRSIAMTVRYSHLAPDFLLDVVERLVPESAEVTSTSPEPTDTTTDTGTMGPATALVAHV